MSGCRRASSCCTGSAAPGAPGTAWSRCSTVNATCRWRSTCPATARPPGERPITFAGCVAAVLARAPERFALCGYSLGGRVALHVALAAPERVPRLVLVSSTAGIEDPASAPRGARPTSALADELGTGPFEEFIERWRTQPLFAEEPPEVGGWRARISAATGRRRWRRRCAALGTGEMEPLWGRLGELTMPVDGARRRPRREVPGARAAHGRAAARRAELLVVRGGHGLPLENPRAVADALATGPTARAIDDSVLNDGRTRLLLVMKPDAPVVSSWDWYHQMPAMFGSARNTL